METEKSQPSGQRIMPETRQTSFPALSVHPWVGISRSASETDDRVYLSLLKCLGACLGGHAVWTSAPSHIALPPGSCTISRLNWLVFVNVNAKAWLQLSTSFC